MYNITKEASTISRPTKNRVRNFLRIIIFNKHSLMFIFSISLLVLVGSPKHVFASDVRSLSQVEVEGFRDRLTNEVQTTIDRSVKSLRLYTDQAFQIVRENRTYHIVTFRYESYRENRFGSYRCMLALVSDGRIDLYRADLVEDEEVHSWECDYMPALRFADINGDAANDILALFPFRPPSNETFFLPLVFVFDPNMGEFHYDDRRSQWLGSGSAVEGLPSTTKEAEQLLIHQYGKDGD